MRTATMHKLQLQLNYRKGGSKNENEIANLCGLRSSFAGGENTPKTAGEFIWQVHKGNLRQQCGRIRNICKPIRKYFCIWKRCTQIQSACFGKLKSTFPCVLYWLAFECTQTHSLSSTLIPAANYLPYVIANLNTKICGTQPRTTSALHITLSRISNQIGPMG